MKILPFIVAIFLCFPELELIAQSLSQRLGYQPDDKLLILHADDLGVAHAENQATFDAFELGMVNSGSIMVPCPWFNEVVEWARKQEDHDLGLHLTLTAEWELLKWGPVSPSDKVPGLTNDQGYFYSNVEDVIANATAEEVETELRAQIERSLKAGLQPTHLDSHMGSLFNKKFFPVYLKLGGEYKLPVMLSENVLEMFPGEKPLVPEHTLMVDRVLMAFPQNYRDGMEQFYTQTLRTLRAGVNVLLVHLAYDNPEMQAVTINHPEYGAHWRQQDFNFFTGETCKKILEEENIHLVTWKQIKALVP